MRFIIDTGRERLEFPLRQGTTIIGRDPACEVQLDYPKVSRRHLCCTVQGTQVTIRDLDSKNGTFVNDERTHEATLQNGDVVRLGGSMQLVFDADDATQAATMGAQQAQQPIPLQPLPEAPPPPPPPTIAEPLKTVPTRPGEPTLAQPQNEDEPTPQDGNMLPAQYTGGPQAAPDARVIERDGHWFAVDPATGREIEIVPAAAQAAAQARPAAKPSPLKRFAAMRPAVKVGIGLLGCLIIAGVVAALMKPPPPKHITRRMSRKQYDQAIEDAVEKLLANDVTSAQRTLARADKALPRIRVAAMLLDICKLWVDFKSKNFAQVRDEAEDRFQELADAEYASIKARTFAKTQIQWIQTENRNESLLYEATEAARKKEWEKAFDYFRQIPQDSICYPEVEKRMLDVRQEIVAANLEAGDRALAAQKWTDAATAYRKAKDYDPDIPDIDEKIKTCEQNERDRVKLEKAMAAKENGEWDQVTMALEGIKPDGPYGKQAAELGKFVEAKGTMAQAQNLYDGGDGKAALEKLKGVMSEEANELRRRIQTVMTAYKAGNDAAAKQDFIKAAQYWQRVVQTEKNDANFYHSDAKIKMSGTDQSQAKLAEALVAKGNKLFKDGNFTAALKAYSDATEMDPEHKMGKGQIDAMHKIAQKRYHYGYANRTENPQTAIYYFKLVVQMTLPNDRLYEQAIEEIQKLKAKGF